MPIDNVTEDDSEMDELDHASSHSESCKDVDQMIPIYTTHESKLDRIYTSSPLKPKGSGFDLCMDIDPERNEPQIVTDQAHIEDSGENISPETDADVKEVEVKSPEYEFSKFSLLTKCSNTFKYDHYLRGCKWAPDGTCLLVNCEDRSLRLFDLPQKLHNRCTWGDSEEGFDDLTPSLKVNVSGLIYDFDWYPFMTSWDQATSCFVSTSSNCPVHLYDAFTGQIRASYRGYDQYDEVTHAFCVSFSSTGTSIFCGYKNCVKIFDVSKPGRDCVSINTKQIGKQKGIVSCVQDNPDMPKVFAVGTYRKSIGVYTVDGSSLCQLIGQGGGLTQVRFSPSGVRLYSAARKDPEILCWDLRRPGTILFSLQRPHSTNQRVYFDISSDDKYLVSGSTDGKVRVWNVFNANGNTNQADFELIPHMDCTNGVSFHKQLPILATSSGQRHFPDIASDDEDSNMFTDKNVKLNAENSIKLWWIGSTNPSNTV